MFSFMVLVECCSEVVKQMVMVVKKKMVMAVMVVTVVGGHFDPKIKIWNSCSGSTNRAPTPSTHWQDPGPGPTDWVPPAFSTQNWAPGLLDFKLTVHQPKLGRKWSQNGFPYHRLHVICWLSQKQTLAGVFPGTAYLTYGVKLFQSKATKIFSRWDVGREAFELSSGWRNTNSRVRIPPPQEILLSSAEKHSTRNTHNREKHLEAIDYYRKLTTVNGWNLLELDTVLKTLLFQKCSWAVWRNLSCHWSCKL